MQTKQRRSRAGYSLIEIMIVVVLIGLISSAVAWNVMGSSERAKRRQTEADAHNLASVVLAFRMDAPSICPDADDLVAAELLDPTHRTVDAWDQPFEIDCSDSFVRVYSAGPDGIFGNEDDVPDPV